MYGRGTCTLIGGLTSPANLRGTETIAIVKGNLIEYNIIDMFGVPGQDGTESHQYFQNGRAVRNIRAINPSPIFYHEHWHVFPGKCKQQVGPEAMDINKWEDDQGPICDVTIIISEIVDFDVNSVFNVPRFVELYAPRLRDRGEGINLDLKLVIFHGLSKEPLWDSAIKINYMPESGFLVICNRAAGELYGNKCQIVSNNIAGPANSNGNDQIAIVSGDEDGWFVVDIFGVIGEDGYGKPTNQIMISLALGSFSHS